MPKYHYLDEFGDVKDGVITLDKIVHGLEQTIGEIVMTNIEISKRLDIIEQKLNEMKAREQANEDV